MGNTDPQTCPSHPFVGDESLNHGFLNGESRVGWVRGANASWFHKLRHQPVPVMENNASWGHDLRIAVHQNFGHFLFSFIFETFPHVSTCFHSTQLLSAAPSFSEHLSDSAALLRGVQLTAAEGQS